MSPSETIQPTSILRNRIAIATGVLAATAALVRWPWIVTNVFSSTYLPHGFCFLWNPQLVWLHVVSDITIWLSYVAIALTLARLVGTSRPQLKFQSVFILFGSFIIACGFTHLIGVVVLWKPLYWFEGDVKLLTAAVSFITAVALPFYLPMVKRALRQAASSAENERRFLAAANSSLDSFYILESIREASDGGEPGDRLDTGEVVDFRFSFVNSIGAQLLHRETSRIVGRNLGELLPGSRVDGLFERYKAVVESGAPFSGEFHLDLGNGNPSWMKLQVVKLEDGIAITASDIGERKRAEEESRRAQAFRESLIEHSPAAVIVTDLDSLIIAVNPAAQKMLRYNSDELVGRATPLLFYDPAEVESLAQRLTADLACAVTPAEAIFFAGLDPVSQHDGEWSFLRKGGTTVTVQVAVTPLKSDRGEATGFMITAYDVSDRKRREQQISHLAHHDALTGLPTRQLLLDRLTMMLARSKRFSSRCALLMIDLNHFKQVNDTLGHDAGDRLLVQVGERLRSAVRAMDTVARMGGDEFVVLVSDLESPADAEQVARKLLAAFDPPFVLDGQKQQEVTASIGVCVYPDGGEDSSALLKNADLAMYHAKASRRHSYQLFDRSIAKIVLQRRNIESALGGALNAGELRLHYQPQYSLTDGRMVGVEALLRWNSESFGVVPPGRFIPVAERSGLILPIGAWVIQTACRELRKMQTQFGPKLVMGVNLSARQLDQPDLLQIIEFALAENRLDPTCLEIEITESLLMHDSPAGADFFAGLRELGVRVAIDDFGTGFSSMSYLLRFSVDRLKIDRCFIQDACTNPASATVTSAIIALAHQLKVSVVAEGVETEEQMAFLKNAGCDDVQGFLLSRPVPAEQLTSPANNYSAVEVA